MHRANQRKVVVAKQPGAISRKAKALTANTAVSNQGTYSTKGTVYQLAKQKNGNVRICVIRSVGGIGDVLMTLPAVKQLKTDFPNMHMTYACDRHTTKEDVYYQVVKNAPFINEVIDARYVDRSRYDGIVDISSVCIRYENANLPTLNRIDIFARACGIPRLKDPLPFYQIESSEKRWAADQVKRFDGKKLVFLHTASFDTKRSWPVNRQLELLERTPDIQWLLSDFNNVISNKHLLTNCYDVSGTTIREKAALIDACDLYVGPDSGPMHIAGVVKKQSICLFGSIPPKARINYYKTHTAITAEPKLSCMACWYKQCDINFKCMVDITVDQVLKKMELML